jgi:hypothetical protein
MKLLRFSNPLIELRKSNGTLIDFVRPLTLPSPPNPGERIKVRGI